MKGHTLIVIVDIPLLESNTTSKTCLHGIPFSWLVRTVGVEHVLWWLVHGVGFQDPVLAAGLTDEILSKCYSWVAFIPLRE